MKLNGAQRTTGNRSEQGKEEPLAFTQKHHDKTFHSAKIEFYNGLIFQHNLKQLLLCGKCEQRREQGSGDKPLLQLSQITAQQEECGSWGSCEEQPHKNIRY